VTRGRLSLLQLSAFLFGVSAGIFGRGYAQEKSPRATRMWNVATVNGAAVSIIDTEGVCVYVAVPSWSREHSPAIAAVPKTQLPKGTGCQ
jgi:hypothetical protein